MRFVDDAAGVRVLFGAGRREEAPVELKTLGTRPLLIVDQVAAQVAAEVRDAIASREVTVIDEVRQHVPIADAEAARQVAQQTGADCLAAIGGGSTVGLAKAVALTTVLPILAVPTSSPTSGRTRTAPSTVPRGGAEIAKTARRRPRIPAAEAAYRGIC